MELIDRITFLTNNKESLENIASVNAKSPFSEDICDFLAYVSKKLMADSRSRIYPDVITFAFWIRKTSVVSLKERFIGKDESVRIGRGIAFHIAPSNVPVNFAYSLVAGLLTGNANIVRVPSKDYPQVSIIVEAINDAFIEFPIFKSYVYLLRYERDKEINDYLSGICDSRVVWGGDATIADLRESRLPSRSNEVTFADRYSFSIIDSDYYFDIEDKARVAEDFYNDTYLTDQNACTSPRIVVWLGNKIEEAKQIFWESVHDVVEKKYLFQDIQGVNKLTSSYLVAASENDVSFMPHEDNLIIRIKVNNVSSKLMELKDNSGFFFEYDCENVMDLFDLCNDKKCQTIGMIGDKELIMQLIDSGVKGIDRVVPVGKTMDFDLIWDGYDLYSLLTRVVTI